MPAKYVSLGRVLKYTPSSTAVARGDVVVIGNIVGVAIEDIPVGTTGGVAISGIFEGPKATGGGTAISQGAALYWNATAGVFTTSSSGTTFAGYAAESAGTSDATVRVLLSPPGIPHA